MSEEWRQIAGHEGTYLVSSFGRVKSLARVVPHARTGTRTIPERILKTPSNLVNLTSSAGVKLHAVSRLVAAAFIGPVSGRDVHHRDGESANNRASNLYMHDDEPWQLAGESWASVRGYDGLYEVSDFGRVRSLSRLVARDGHEMVIEGRILRPATKDTGYRMLHLCKDGRTKPVVVARLVAVAFLCKSRSKEVDHRDGDRANDHVSNLRWATRKQQSANSRRNTLNTSGRKGVSKTSNGKKWRAQICPDNTYIHLGTFDKRKDAAAAYEAAARRHFGDFAKPV